VGRSGKPDVLPSLTAALRRVKPGSKLGARILVQDDLAEDVRISDLPNISIEADEGSPVTWRPASGSAPQKLLMLNNVPGFRLKGLTLDGEGRVEALINLYRYCPGAVLEDLTLKGFIKYGVWVTNCEGGRAPDQHVSLLRLHFTTAQPSQTALFFDVLHHTRQQIAKDRYFRVRDCTFGGPGGKVKTPDLGFLEQVELPAGVEAVPVK
jgi:hypothetical protein